MIPRGEVGLIFAGLGGTLMLDGKPILSPAIFSALVLMVMLTTFITPPLLKIAFERRKPPRPTDAEPVSPAMTEAHLQG